jgi:hypothetical protein
MASCSQSLAPPGPGPQQDMAATPAVAPLNLLGLFQREQELVELIFPPQRVIAGLAVCKHARNALIQACQSSSSRLQVSVRVRCQATRFSYRLSQAHVALVNLGIMKRPGSPDGDGDEEAVFEEQDRVGFARFCNAQLHLSINPSPASRAPVSVFRWLHRSLRYLYTHTYMHTHTHVHTYHTHTCTQRPCCRN